MQYLGDVKVGRTLRFAFDTQADGVPSTLSAATVRVYKDASTTESSSGVTLTTDYDARTGLNHVAIDLSTDGTFYAAGVDCMVVLTAGTVGGVSIMRVLGHFSIENRCTNWAQVVSPTTAVVLSGTTIGIVSALAAGSIAAATFAANALDAVWSTATRLLTAGTNIVLAKGVGLTGLNDVDANTNADALLDRANGIETGYTLRQALRIMSAALAGKLSGAATATVTIRNMPDAKARITATVDTDGNRSAVTLDGT